MKRESGGAGQCGVVGGQRFAVFTVASWAPSDDAVRFCPLTAPMIPASSDEACIILYWTLLCTPWPARVRGHALHGVSALGAVFDALNVRPHLLRSC